jgi:hypothetical protein
MSSTITAIVSDLNDSIDNRYALVLEIADMAKRLLDESRAKGDSDYVSGSLGSSETSLEKAIYQSLIMKASEIDMGDGLIG